MRTIILRKKSLIIFLIYILVVTIAVSAQNPAAKTTNKPTTLTTPKPKPKTEQNVKIIVNQKPFIEWVEIPSGTFTMGSPISEVGRNDDETQHQVTLNAFKISKYEITVGQFKTFVDSTSYVTDIEKRGSSFMAPIAGNRMYKTKVVSWKSDESADIRPETDLNYPVIRLSWNDAKAFADWVGCRLPTEAEWEYACRASSTTTFNTGNCLSTKDANYRGDIQLYSNCSLGQYRGEIMPVGSFAPNAWGLYDMHGNVKEWCSDWYGNYTTDAQTDIKEIPTEKGHVYRGGGWGTRPMDCRSAYRGYILPNNDDETIGFRIVSLK